MTSLRITQNSMNRTQMMGLNTSLSRLQGTQEQLTTGKRLNRPSDDPVGTVQALRFRSEQSQLAQFGANITDGLSRLSAGDNALSETLGMVQKIRSTTVSALNGVNGDAQRKAFASSIRELRVGILQQANSQYAGQPLFGGTTPLDNAFDANGTYQGNTLPVLRQVSDSPGDAGQMNVGISGSDAFGTALVKGSGALDKLADAIEAGDQAGIEAGLKAVEGLNDSILNVQTSVGVRVNRLQGLENLNGRMDDSSKISLSKVEDTDFIKAAMDLSIQSNAYQAALSASAKIIQPSLMDFIR
ncbi:flagellar hook-associated protein FlgL [Dermatophilus congolensis]|uniref:flagellar hook-associated protein FlgL n=1 Tax=Dermatophilus congolensis TaxID=1863 RepID=UPI001AAEBA33|nr:flagellar hook-associated protein FlgL [Dermatophilus congolensis]MBO3143415.1 flagellar hook-associated protein 3 [Dermatophilus congolensis]MBO3152405.1 flagellar hook-associated protein 3 [Dermatophilus congolensis]MBO3160584.1 flagellar hook-associated protein 3 [Dermatophilus congolensis]MBO3163693.1 flagellar hook-associated protein 3 [Dermatophilus congolensis]MBO3177239.1 flagellar hook-associated protein 3 [Dermatophilus congolensis]